MIPDPLALWAELVAGAADLRPGKRLLDVGGGSGLLATKVAEWTGAECIVVEPEPGEGEPGVPRVAGSANALPFPDASADAVLFSHVLHHTGNPAQAIGEAARVLAPGGRLVVRTASHDDLRALPFARFIPLLLRGILDATPDTPALAHWITEAGLSLCEVRPIQTPQTMEIGVYAEGAAMQAWRNWAMAADGGPNPRDEVRAWVLSVFPVPPPVAETLIVASREIGTDVNESAG